MTDDKKLNMVCNILLVLIGMSIVYSLYSEGSGRRVDYPEELREGAEVGDTLIVEKVDSTITIGFKR